MTKIEVLYIDCIYRPDENYYYKSLFLDIYIKVYSKDYIYDVGIQYSDNNWNKIKLEKAKHIYTHDCTSDINVWKCQIPLIFNDINCWPNINIEYAIYVKIYKNDIGYTVWNNNLNKNFLIPMNKLEKYTFLTNNINIDNISFCFKNMDEYINYA